MNNYFKFMDKILQNGCKLPSIYLKIIFKKTFNFTVKLIKYIKIFLQ